MNEKAVSWALRRPLQAADAKLMLLVLSAHADASGTIRISREQMLEETALDEARAREALALLIDGRYLEDCPLSGGSRLPWRALCTLH